MQIKRPFCNKLRTLLTAAALAGAATLALPAPQAHAAVFVSVGIAPPVIPVYAQPLCPGDGYLWTPGYWAYGPDGYYWVDGAWVEAPYAGALWTPGWWGWGGGLYYWHPGYWGRTVGYYGGINYGFGYFGTGFYGGYWRGGAFVYNRAYGHFAPGFRGAVYSRTYAGFSGRPGGASFNAHPPARFAAAHGGAAAFHGSTVNGARPAESSHGYAGTRSSQGFANRGGYNGYNRGATANYNRAPAASYGRPQQSYGSTNRSSSAPARRSSAPAQHYSAPSGGYHGGGGSNHTSSSHR